MLYFGDTAYEGNMFTEKQLGADWETENKTERFMKELGCCKFTEKRKSCTHLYCKPCLAHVANWSRACSYDGYLVTEADSKALIESDKTLAESIGRVKVRLSLSQKWMHMGSSQALATASAGVPTSEQWYHQHYQQYAGYEPYQQQTYQQLIHGFKTHFDALSKWQ
ncbi:hypothetical protein KY289_007293 [Solanum tuberosum]|nr:hypothetical protein KY289_007293 [Solanum tuberosum]